MCVCILILAAKRVFPHQRLDYPPGCVETRTKANCQTAWAILSQEVLSRVLISLRQRRDYYDQEEE